MQRDPALRVQSILGQGRSPNICKRAEQAPWYPANVPGQPVGVLPTKQHARHQRCSVAVTHCCRLQVCTCWCGCCGVLYLLAAYALPFTLTLCAVTPVIYSQLCMPMGQPLCLTQLVEHFQRPPSAMHGVHPVDGTECHVALNAIQLPGTRWMEAP